MQRLIKKFIKEHEIVSEDSVCKEAVSNLKAIVEEISFPRDWQNNKNANEKAKQIVFDNLALHCDYVNYDGPYNNIIAGWGEPGVKDKVLLGAHYDGPGLSPGADDNGSALAVMIETARRLKSEKPDNCFFVAFNAEEYNMLGSQDFVKTHPAVKQAIILEMVGYFTSEEGTQEMPEGFPKYSRGDFLAIIGNRHSKNINKKMFKHSKSCGLPVKSIKIPFGLEDKLTGLDNVKRSDHYYFWQNGIPAVMLTDTAEFRNKNYHYLTDTPETLNYESMSKVVNIIVNYYEACGFFS